jgi:antitoxin component YwqK of YwqJK toxin-antitoxin module
MAKARETRPRLNRISFYRLRGDEFFELLFECIEQSLGSQTGRARRWARLNPYQQGVWAWWPFSGNLLNGGLVQYFYNEGDACVEPLKALLVASDNAPMADLLAEATAVYRKNRKAFATEKTFGADGLFSRMTDLNQLDGKWQRLLRGTDKRLQKWLCANISLIAVGDDGQEIDATFSGNVETRYPGGQVFEQAQVRRGVISGCYRRFCEDGKLEHEGYYKGGKVATDYWPNGQPKRKRTEKGAHEINEWYYASGQLQKRYVSDKSGEAIEPIRLWHENGQLAEELHVKKGKLAGPWLKFFDDGSPRLEAKHVKNESLVVKNAWDDERRQTVKNGRGVYFDEGISINWKYDLFFKFDCTRLLEMRNGIRHGEAKTWHSGILWSIDQYVRGQPHGTNVLFYDNGRVHMRIKYQHGKEIKVEKFDKLDQPRPAVLIEVEANAELYKSWRHPVPDSFPKPRNLKQVQSRLQVPEFLAQVYDRNKAGQLNDEYEDWNSFDDSIGYWVMVDDRGIVDDVQFTGSDVYSGGAINDYPPLLGELKFTPGRIGKQSVRCRVMVHVHHTFAEAE